MGKRAGVGQFRGLEGEFRTPHPTPNQHLALADHIIHQCLGKRGLISEM